MRKLTIQVLNMNELKTEYNTLENESIEITLSGDEVQAIRELRKKISE